MKTGLIVGLALAAGAVLWLATRPSLNPKTVMPDVPDIVTPQESVLPPAPVAVEKPVSEPPPPSPPPAPAVVQQNEQPDLTQYEQAEKIKTQKFHIVQKGDTLSKISSQYYGSAGKWQKILEANRQILKDPNKLTPGTKLLIPD